MTGVRWGRLRLTTLVTRHKPVPEQFPPAAQDQDRAHLATHIFHYSAPPRSKPLSTSLQLVLFMMKLEFPPVARATRSTKASRPRSPSPISPPPRKSRKIKHSPTPGEAKVKDVVKNRVAASPLKDRKLALHGKSVLSEPFPTFARPTPAECHLAHRILSDLHGVRNRPKVVVASKDRAGCGDSPSVLDALVRTILSQNTSDTNSSRAKKSMDATYGSSDAWEEIVQGGQEKLQEAIKCGGLSQVKSRVILKILEQVYDKYGVYSLDHLHEAGTEEAMQELLSFDGVGPKTASCVLLFCLGREDFAVDTHVWRITGLLGWRPPKASRDQTYFHLNKRIPDEDKYGLHILLVTHGKRCSECKAGGRVTGYCELRKAFSKGAKKDPEVKAELELIEDDPELDNVEGDVTEVKVKEE